MLRIRDAFGRLDILVNNAGGQFVTPARELNNKGFETVIRKQSDRLLADDQGRLPIISCWSTADRSCS